MLDLLVLADHLNNTHKNTMIPKTSEILPAPIIIFLFLFSSSVNSDQGFCFLPIAIPIAMPIGVVRIAFGRYLMKGLRLIDTLKNQYIYSKTFDKSDTLIGIFLSCYSRKIYGHRNDNQSCKECVSQFICEKLVDESSNNISKGIITLDDFI